MADPEALLRALDFAETHLRLDVGVDGMAAAACLSPFHFSRVFSRAFLVGPWEWIVRRRLAEAAKALVAGSLDVTTAAFEFGFSGLDVFARAMKRACGLLPSDLKRGLPSLRPALERPSGDVVRMCADGSRAPSAALGEFKARRLTGETLFAGEPSERARVEWLEGTIRRFAAGSGPAESATIAIRRGPSGNDALMVRSSGGGDTAFDAPGGPWVLCSVPSPGDILAARSWFRGIALAVAPFDADLRTEIIELGDGMTIPSRVMIPVIRD